MSSDADRKSTFIRTDLILQDIVGNQPLFGAPITDRSPVTDFKRVSTIITRSERWEHFKCRIGGFRDKYIVSPGLYALGEPDENDDVLISANYKLSFDTLRKELGNLNLWVLVLDTKGINVWCAAGKGTFGTEELLRRINEVRLSDLVQHRRIIVPQLGAVGVNAGEIRRRCGFRVRFGPVLAKDIPAYIGSDYKKTRQMSTIRFPLKDRVILTPMELNPVLKKYPWFAAGVLVLFGLQRSGIIFSDAWSLGWPFLLLGLISILAGAFITPALLPYIPFRSFALKGWITGFAAVFLASLAPAIAARQQQYTLLLIISYLLFPALTSYIALQFTGSTTFTGISGVKKELRIGAPLYITAAAVSAFLLLIFKLQELGIL